MAGPTTVGSLTQHTQMLVVMAASDSESVKMIINRNKYQSALTLRGTGLGSESHL